MDRRERRSCTPSLEIGIPSITIQPAGVDSHSRNSAVSNEDLPAPVRPTTPIFSPPYIYICICMYTYKNE
jgi:hypothetical protein